MFRSVALGEGTLVLVLSALAPSLQTQVPVDNSRVLAPMNSDLFCGG